MRRDLADPGDPQLAEGLQHAVFTGGKRIRPQLVLLTWQLAGGREDETALLRLAIAFEYLHVASLLHDDVIDHASQRRGQPTVNALWGLAPALLAGDFLHSRALHLVGEVAGRAGVDLMGRAIAAMVAAEFLQARLAAAGWASEADYFQVARGKTGALIGSACEAGVLLAGGDRQARLASRLYGENLGLAFQIVDDLLDYLGDPARTGKALGNDLAEGKLTLPLLFALDEAEAAETARIRELLGAAGEEERRSSFAEVREMIERRGGFARARGRAAELVREGTGALASFPPGFAAELLTGLSSYVLSRDK